MLKKLIITMLCFLIIASGAGCWDAREIDDWAYVYAIGIDKGVSDQIRFTILIPTYKGPSGSSSGGAMGTSSQGKGDYTVISLDCPTLYAGINMINASLPRTLNYTHAKYMVVSEAVAKQGVDTFVNGMRRTRQIRRIMHFIVVRGAARQFIQELSPAIGVAISKSMESMMNQEDETGYFDDTTYGLFIDDMKSKKTQASCPLAAVNDFSHFLSEGVKPPGKQAIGDYHAGEMPRQGGNRTEYLGSAIFNGDKMVGELTGDETRILLMANGEFVNAAITIPDPKKNNKFVTVVASQEKKPNVTINFREGTPEINLHIFLTGNIQNIQSGINYESVKLKPVLENAFKAYINNKFNETITKCQRLNSDIFGFGDVASMQFLTIQDWEAFHWLNRFKDARVTTEVEFTIKLTGTVLKTNQTEGADEMLD